ncbi:roadblock/LC7 domain-containing protein [Streptomyces alkaliphilus]|uniref:Roadblock/LC7 domain-containing protein n=1 Tax=Streptomyces alkaliphilus TaxID=1472722 RepID=A0A7W3Y356_9ACTN|nr:roadblock/LC7 domain-containing protein [Streptomyces alkaliphilus]MBB0246116.1 roadblock/LC7 domain-containing protein [Streptomyces alkaliphilus]
MADEQPAPTADTTDLGWALDQLAAKPGIEHALLFTSDGLEMARSRRLGKDEADRAAALYSGLMSLQASLQGFESFDGQELRLRHVTIDLKAFTVLLFTAGERTSLAVVVRGDSTTKEIPGAVTDALKMITGMKPVLAARDRARG